MPSSIHNWSELLTWQNVLNRIGRVCKTCFISMSTFKAKSIHCPFNVLSVLLVVQNKFKARFIFLFYFIYYKYFYLSFLTSLIVLRKISFKQKTTFFKVAFFCQTHHTPTHRKTCWKIFYIFISMGFLLFYQKQLYILKAKKILLLDIQFSFLIFKIRGRFPQIYQNWTKIWHTWLQIISLPPFSQSPKKS